MNALTWFLVFMVCFCGLAAVGVFWAWCANDTPATPHVGPDPEMDAIDAFMGGGPHGADPEMDAIENF
jgi:hypothetical protein